MHIEENEDNMDELIQKELDQADNEEEEDEDEEEVEEDEDEMENV